MLFKRVWAKTGWNLGKKGLEFGQKRAKLVKKGLDWAKTGWNLGKNGLDIIEMSIIQRLGKMGLYPSFLKALLLNSLICPKVHFTTIFDHFATIFTTICPKFTILHI